MKPDECYGRSPPRKTFGIYTECTILNLQTQSTCVRSVWTCTGFSGCWPGKPENTIARFARLPRDGPSLNRKVNPGVPKTVPSRIAWIMLPWPPGGRPGNSQCVPVPCFRSGKLYPREISAGLRRVHDALYLTDSLTRFISGKNTEQFLRQGKSKKDSQYNSSGDHQCLHTFVKGC